MHCLHTVSATTHTDFLCWPPISLLVLTTIVPGKFRLSDEAAREKLAYFERLGTLDQNSRRLLRESNSSLSRRQLPEGRGQGRKHAGGRNSSMPRRQRPGGHRSPQGRVFNSSMPRRQRPGGRRPPQGRQPGGRQQAVGRQQPGGRKEPKGPVVDPLPLSGPAIPNHAMKGRRLIKTHAARCGARKWLRGVKLVLFYVCM